MAGLHLLLVVVLAPLGALAQDRDTAGSEPAGQGITWFDGHRPRTFRQAPDEVVVLGRGADSVDLPLEAAGREIFPGAIVVESGRAMVRLRLPRPLHEGEVAAARHAARAFPAVELVSPVFYPERSPADSAVTYAFSGSMVVQFEAPADVRDAAEWGGTLGLALLGATVIEDAYLFACPPDPECADQANRAYATERIRYAYPNWLKPREPRAFVPDDPLYPDQWHLENTGQSGGTAGEDINVLDSWTDYDGTGVTIAVVDDGLEIAHPDLAANVLSGRSYDYVDDDTDPTPTSGLDGHGTAVAGVAAARGANGTGVTGVAPFASLVGFNLLQFFTDSNEADALTRAEDVVDISSNSWGPFDSNDYYAAPGPLAAQALEDGVTSGRDGKGTIYVWAGGNGGDTDNANLDGYANSRYTIGVAASTHNGTRSSYSEPGANLHVNAPSSGDGVGITTTDLTGSGGYNGIPGNNDYTNDFGGTSSATPLVSGVIALALQANPALTWRDVQALLVTSAELNDPAHADWVQNAAGHWVNHYYGFGRVDAGAAVTAAESWTLLGPEVSADASRTPGLAIPDNDPAGISDTLEFADDIRIESVDVHFETNHTWGGDLDIRLTSPGGTEAVLQQVIAGNSEDPGAWRFGVTRFFGETSAGTWTLEVSDNFAQDTGTLQSWSIEVYGTAVGGPACSVPDDTLVLDAFTVSGSELYEACTSIEAKAVTVPDGGSLTLRAGSHVQLQNGFTVEKGGTLAVDIAVP